MSQEDLAGLLNVDRRQVVRLEHGEVPPTLEVIEAVAQALGVPAFAFMYPALPQAGSQAPDAEAEFVAAVEKWVLRDARERFQAAIERPQLAALMAEAIALPETQLGNVVEVARAFRRAQFVADHNEAPTPLDPVFTPLARPARPRRRKNGKAQQR